MFKTVLLESLAVTLLFVLGYALLVMAPAFDQTLIEYYARGQ